MYAFFVCARPACSRILPLCKSDTSCTRKALRLAVSSKERRHRSGSIHLCGTYNSSRPADARPRSYHFLRWPRHRPRPRACGAYRSRTHVGRKNSVWRSVVHFYHFILFYYYCAWDRYVIFIAIGFLARAFLRGRPIGSMIVSSASCKRRVNGAS